MPQLYTVENGLAKRHDIDSPSFLEANPRYLTQPISVLAAKGGTGKSNVTVAQALSLAAMGYNVLVVDMDPTNHSVPSHLGMHDYGFRLNAIPGMGQFLLLPKGHGSKKGLLASIVHQSFSRNSTGADEVALDPRIDARSVYLVYGGDRSYRNRTENVNYVERFGEFVSLIRNARVLTEKKGSKLVFPKPEATLELPRFHFIFYDMCAGSENYVVDGSVYARRQFVLEVDSSVLNPAFDATDRIKQRGIMHYGQKAELDESTIRRLQNVATAKRVAHEEMTISLREEITRIKADVNLTQHESLDVIVNFIANFSILVVLTKESMERSKEFFRDAILPYSIEYGVEARLIGNFLQDSLVHEAMQLRRDPSGRIIMPMNFYALPHINVEGMKIPITPNDDIIRNVDALTQNLLQQIKWPVPEEVK